MNKITAAVIAAIVFTLSVAPAYGLIGPLIEGFMVTSSFGSYRMYVPSNNPEGGIHHDLRAEDWVRFRIKVTHEDSSQLAFVSDGFAPTNENIQLCTEEGCEALPIDLGNEALDWNDKSKITFVLEAKQCVLCSWTPFEIAQQ